MREKKSHSQVKQPMTTTVAMGNKIIHPIIKEKGLCEWSVEEPGVTLREAHMIKAGRQ